MFQESIELTKLHQILTQENSKLKDEYSKIEQAKLARQTLISSVEKAVKEKRQDFASNHQSNSSWLVFKLNRQVYELRSKIEQKEKAIRTLQFNKENQLLRQKQIELNCLEEIIDWAADENLMDEKSNLPEETIREAVWMEQFLRTQDQEILQLESVYDAEDHEVKKIMKELAAKKTEIKNIHKMEDEYYRSQEQHKLEKRKKESKISGNKTYVCQMQEERNAEEKKLKELKAQFDQIEVEENIEIRILEEKLMELEKEYESSQQTRQQLTSETNKVELSIPQK